MWRNWPRPHRRKRGLGTNETKWEGQSGLGGSILPRAGPRNGSIGTVIEAVHRSGPIGPNGKRHGHLPDCVVAGFPRLKLPPCFEPWDKLHPAAMPE